MALSFDERDEREEQEREVRVLISDKRHSRDLEGAEEEEAPADEPAAATPEAAQGDSSLAGGDAASAAVLDFPGPEAAARPLVPTPATEASASTDDFDDDSAPWATGQVEAEMPARPGGAEAGDAAAAGQFEGQGEMSEEEQAAAALEMAQLRQVFAGGLSRYLQAQLGLLLNFALIGLGRAPDPTSGLVTQNLAQARLAIDVLEFLVLRLENELHPQDRQQLAQLVSDLKYAFMQAVAPQSGSPGGIAGPGGIVPPGAGA